MLVLDHMKRTKTVRNLYKGDYFGEVGLLFGVSRTATVRSTNYCTMATLAKSSLMELFYRFPGIYSEMWEAALDYDNMDKWKEFKILLLKQIEYLNPDLYPNLDNRFYS